jgi:hypothetical protein
MQPFYLVTRCAALYLLCALCKRAFVLLLLALTLLVGLPIVTGPAAVLRCRNLRRE